MEGGGRRRDACNVLAAGHGISAMNSYHQEVQLPSGKAFITPPGTAWGGKFFCGHIGVSVGGKN